MSGEPSEFISNQESGDAGLPCHRQWHRVLDSSHEESQRVQCGPGRFCVQSLLISLGVPWLHLPGWQTFNHLCSSWMGFRSALDHLSWATQGLLTTCPMCLAWVTSDWRHVCPRVAIITMSSLIPGSVSSASISAEATSLSCHRHPLKLLLSSLLPLQNQQIFLPSYWIWNGTKIR